MFQCKLCSSHFYAGKGPLVPPRPFFALLRMPFCRWSFASGSSAARIFMLAKGPLVPPDPSFLCLLAAGHVPAEAPNAFLPLVVCQRKLRSSHFYGGKGPFSPPRPFFALLRVPFCRWSCASGSSECLFAVGRLPAKAPQLAFSSCHRAL